MECYKDHFSYHSVGENINLNTYTAVWTMSLQSKQNSITVRGEVKDSKNETRGKIKYMLKSSDTKTRCLSNVIIELTLL